MGATAVLLRVSYWLKKGSDQVGILRGWYNNNNNNTIYIALIKSEDTEVLGDAGLSLTEQMSLNVA